MAVHTFALSALFLCVISLTSCDVVGKLFGYGDSGGGGAGGGGAGGTGGGSSVPVIYVATDDAGLAVSKNSGVSWTVYNSSTSGFASNRVLSVFVSGSTIYAGLGSGGSNGLSISTNQGATWTNYLNGYNVQGIWASGSTIYAATDGGLQKSVNGGALFTVDPVVNVTHNSRAVLVSGSKIYVGTNGGGVFISLDTGTNWTQHSGTLAGPYVANLALSGGTLYAATSTSGGAGDVSATSNDGTTWTSLSATSGYPAYAVYVSGSSLYAGAPIGAFVSTNGGNTWATIYSAKVNGIASAGSKLYLATGSNGLQVSSDGGTNWSAVAGLPSNNLNAVLIQ